MENIKHKYAYCELDFLMEKPNFVDGSCLTILLVMALEMEAFAFLRPSSMVGHHPKLQNKQIAPFGTQNEKILY